MSQLHEKCSQGNASSMQYIRGKLFDNTGQNFFTIFQKPRPEAWVKMAKKRYVTLCNPKMYLHTHFLFLPETKYRYAPGSAYIELKPVVKGHSDPETIVDSSRPKDVFTYQSFNIYYRRYALYKIFI